MRFSTNPWRHKNKNSEILKSFIVTNAAAVLQRWSLFAEAVPCLGSAEKSPAPMARACTAADWGVCVCGRDRKISKISASLSRSKSVTSIHRFLSVLRAADSKSGLNSKVGIIDVKPNTQAQFPVTLSLSWKFVFDFACCEHAPAETHWFHSIYWVKHSAGMAYYYQSTHPIALRGIRPVV